MVGPRIDAQTGAVPPLVLEGPWRADFGVLFGALFASRSNSATLNLHDRVRAFEGWMSSTENDGTYHASCLSTSRLLLGANARLASR